MIRLQQILSEIQIIPGGKKLSFETVKRNIIEEIRKEAEYNSNIVDPSWSIPRIRQCSNLDELYTTLRYDVMDRDYLVINLLLKALTNE